MPKLRHYDNLNTARFVTFSCYRRLNGFKDRRACLLFIKHLKHARTKHGFKLYGYVIMPNHIHLVIHLSFGSKLGVIIREIKSKMAREYFSIYVKDKKKSTNVFWMKRCYDHNCRSPKTVLEKIEYCHKNPVRGGLVDSATEWEWSSFNYYQGVKDLPIRMDEIQ